MLCHNRNHSAQKGSLFLSGVRVFFYYRNRFRIRQGARMWKLAKEFRTRTSAERTLLC
jgi:hypothetical protein